MSAARCAILSFIDYVDNGMGPRCQKSIRRSHFYWLEIRRHLLAYCHDLGALLGKTLAVALVLCSLVARVGALLIRRYNYCLAVTRAGARYC